MEPILTTLAVIGIILLVITVVVLLIRAKLNSMTRNYLGMNLSDAAGMISKGIKEEAALPKPVSNMTAVYAPKVKRDFPELGYEGMEAIARNGLISIFNGIENENTEKLTDASAKLKNQVQNIIDDNSSKNIKVSYDDITIHKSSLSDYKKTDKSATAYFEFSLQYVYTETDRETEKNKGGSTQPLQTAYQVILSYDQDEYLETTNMVYTSNCPNCGAPVSAVTRVCEYCGSRVTEVAVDRLWKVNSFKQIK